MPKRPPRDPKADALQEQGVMNPHAGDVTDPLFVERDFFDARDVVQVKYEMLRRVEAEGQSVTQTAASFGFSRPSYYQAQSALRRQGVSGLLPRKRGPRGGHKLTAEVLGYIEKLRAEDASLRAPALARLVEQRFGTAVHPRSVERALGRRKKKRH
jgi:transposase